mmetsp:Transcript_5602/g.12745  ORF Transcript_5602/g.12745 Transcript_5602/m.12745 type:complete len:223 (+) Transcript_5602:2936-3604(+)
MGARASTMSRSGSSPPESTRSPPDSTPLGEAASLSLPRPPSSPLLTDRRSSTCSSGSVCAICLNSVSFLSSSSAGSSSSDAAFPLSAPELPSCSPPESVGESAKRCRTFSTPPGTRPRSAANERRRPALPPCGGFGYVPRCDAFGESERSPPSVAAYGLVDWRNSTSIATGSASAESGQSTMSPSARQSASTHMYVSPPDWVRLHASSTSRAAISALISDSL